MSLDPEVQRYIADQAFVRVDLIAWASTALLIAILVRIVANPLVLLIQQVQLTTVAIITAWRK